MNGSAQCGSIPIPGAKVQLFSGAGLVAATTADSAGQFAFPPAAPGVYAVGISSGDTVCGYQVTITPAPSPAAASLGLAPAVSTSALAVITGAQCPADSRNNHSWITASLLDGLTSTPAPATVDECLYLQDQSAWFKVPIQPGSKVVVSLTNLPANYDLTLYKDSPARISRWHRLQRA